MRLMGLIRLGRDAELRYTQDGDPVVNIAAAWNYGRKGEDNKRPTQWAELSLWGERAEKLHEYLLRGREFLVVVTDVHVETYVRNDQTTGAKLVGRIADLDFTAGSFERSASGTSGAGGRPISAPPSAGSSTAPPRSGLTGNQSTGSDFVPDGDFDDDIPF